MPLLTPLSSGFAGVNGLVATPSPGILPTPLRRAATPVPGVLAVAPKFPLTGRDGSVIPLFRLIPGLNISVGPEHQYNNIKKRVIVVIVGVVIITVAVVVTSIITIRILYYTTNHL